MIFQAPPSRSSLNLWLRRATFGSVDPTLPIIVAVFPFRLTSEIRGSRIFSMIPSTASRRRASPVAVIGSDGSCSASAPGASLNATARIHSKSTRSGLPAG